MKIFKIVAPQFQIITIVNLISISMGERENIKLIYLRDFVIYIYK